MAVPGVPVFIGSTLEEAETTVNAATVLIIISRPGYAEAVGNVTVIVAVPLQVIQFSVSAKVKLVVFTIGAPRPKDPPMLMWEVPVGFVIIAPPAAATSEKSSALPVAPRI